MSHFEEQKLCKIWPTKSNMGDSKMMKTNKMVCFSIFAANCVSEEFFASFFCCNLQKRSELQNFRFFVTTSVKKKQEFTWEIAVEDIAEPS